LYKKAEKYIIIKTIQGDIMKGVFYNQHNSNT